MAADVHLSEPAAELLTVAGEVVAPWLRRLVLAAARAVDEPLDVDDPAVAAALDEMVDRTAASALDELEQLLTTDVDQQRTTPLSIFRAATAGPTGLLETLGVPHPAARADHPIPDDPYRLAPAAWSDVDERLHEPGIVWGAWKAMTVLQRRRAGG